MVSGHFPDRLCDCLRWLVSFCGPTPAGAIVIWHRSRYWFHLLSLSPASRRDQTVKARDSATKTKDQLWERRLRRYLDRTVYLACAALVAMIVWLATTRPPTLFSFVGTSDHCNKRRAGE